MKTKLLALTLLGASAMFAETRFSIGVGIGAPVAPVAVAPAYGYYNAPPAYAVVPPAPGPGFYFVQGYWSGVGAHRVWHNGYWNRRPVYRGGYHNDFRGHDRFDYRHDHR